MKQPARTVYEYMGGEEGIHRLINRFYDLMDSSAEAANIRALHASSLKMSREKLFMFFSGWTGGTTRRTTSDSLAPFASGTLTYINDASRKAKKPKGADCFRCGRSRST